MSAESIAALLREVLACPDNRAVREVYADALIEAGDPRGAYIAASLTGDWKTAGELERAHGDRWRAGVPADVHVSFADGFIEELEGPPALLVLALRRLADREPVTTVHVVHDPDEPDDAWTFLLEAPVFATIGRLRLVSYDAPPALLRHPGARGLEAIELTWMIHPDAFIDDDVDPLVAELPTLDPLPRLRDFRISTEHFLIPGLVDAVVASPFCGSIETLGLGAARTPADVRALLESPHLQRIRHLELEHLDDDAIRALAEHPASARLMRLRLDRNHVSDAAAAALVASPYLRAGLALRIANNQHQHLRLADRFELE